MKKKYDAQNPGITEQIIVRGFSNLENGIDANVSWSLDKKVRGEDGEELNYHADLVTHNIPGGPAMRVKSRTYNPPLPGGYTSVVENVVFFGSSQEIQQGFEGLEGIFGKGSFREVECD